MPSVSFVSPVGGSNLLGTVWSKRHARSEQEMMVNSSQDRSARSSSVIRVINKCRLAADMKPALASCHQHPPAPRRRFVSPIGSGQGYKEPIWIAHCCSYNYKQNVKIDGGVLAAASHAGFQVRFRICVRIESWSSCSPTPSLS